MAVGPTPALHHAAVNDRVFKARLQQLRRTDNYTNFFYIARAYLFAALAIGSCVSFHQYQQAHQLSFWWNVPIWLVAIAVVGASQHQLAGATHEATHHTLFKNRLLNELASDWLCMFPLFSSTHQFRVYHLAHHQFINHPQLDPDFAMLQRSGHWMEFPVSPKRFLLKLLSQAFLVQLVWYIVVRVRYNSVGTTETNPYRRTDRGNRVAFWVGAIFFVGMAPLFFTVFSYGQAWHVPLAAAIYWSVFALVFWLLPDRCYERCRLHPVISYRLMALSRSLYLVLLLGVLFYIRKATGIPASRYFLLLWIVPLLTTFSFCLILRQLVQHGNGDRGRLTNTSVFLVNPLVRYAVFPFGMDYHLPHHLYATVPHYRLPELHQFLLGCPAYSAKCQVVENYLIPKGAQPRNPTVVESLGPDHIIGGDADVFTDHSVLDTWTVDERDEVLRHAGAE